MVKPFQGRTLLSLLPAAIILVLGMVVLNSCGQGNPAGSQAGTAAAPSPGMPNRNTPAATIPLAMTSPPLKVELSNASDTATISWNNYPGVTSYNLYYSNTPDFANSTKITGISSPYDFPLADSQKSYFFFLTAGNGTTEQRISGDFISLYQNGNRYSIVLSFDAIYKLFQRKQTANLSFPFMEKAYADILYWPSTVHADSSLTAFLNVGSPITQILLDAQVLHKAPDGSYIYEEMVESNNWNHPTNRCSTAINGIFTYTAKYSVGNAPGSWGVYLGPATIGRFTNINTSISFQIDKLVTGHYTFIGHGIQSWYSNYCMKFSNWPSGYLQVRADRQVLTVNNSQVGGYWGDGFLLDFDLVASGTAFTVTPASQTAYLHPTPTPVQFTAKDGNNTDVTNTARWTVEPTTTTPPVTIANINNGLATPLKPGEASVTAALVDGAGNVTASGGATLVIKCRQYNVWGQGGTWSWANESYDHEVNPTTNNYYTIAWKGCALTNYAMVFNAFGRLGLNTNMTAPGMNPSVLNQWLNENGGYLDTVYNPKTKRLEGSGMIDPNVLAWFMSLNVKGTTSLPDLDNALSNCNPVMVEVHYTDSAGTLHTHYVLVTQKTGNIYEIIDTFGNGSNSQLSAYGNSIYSITTFN